MLSLCRDLPQLAGEFLFLEPLLGGQWLQRDGFVCCGDVVQRRQHHLVIVRRVVDDVRVVRDIRHVGDIGHIRDIVYDDVLLNQCSGWSGNRSVESADVDIVDADRPVDVISIGDAIIIPERIIAYGSSKAHRNAETAAANIRAPGGVADARVAAFEIISEVVASPAASDEQGRVQGWFTDDERRRIDESWAIIDRAWQIHRSEKHSAIGQGHIPISVDENISCRCPSVVRGDPDPTGAMANPNAGTPDITRCAPDPGPGNVDMRFAGRGNGRGDFEWSRRGAQVFDVGTENFGACFLPEAVDPLVTAADFAPASSDPDASWWWNAPESADPDEIFAFFIPVPVSRNPLHILAIGLLIRWQFLDRIGRSLSNQDWIFLDFQCCGEGFVDRSTGENLDFASFLSRDRTRDREGQSKTGETPDDPCGESS